MPPSPPKDGIYASKQIYSQWPLIAFSHRKRFQTGLDLVAPIATGRRILDYGCGDGTFVRDLVASGCSPSDVIGAEIAEDLLESCRRHSHWPNLRFVNIDDLSGTVDDASIDVIVCMEVLEHAVQIESLLDRLHALLIEGGVIIISVPVETGPVLLIKQGVRITAGWCNVGDYRWTSRYTLSEYWKSLIAGATQHMARPIYRSFNSFQYHCHKGFNWRHLESRIAERFQILRILGSPFRRLPPYLGSQVWFVAQKARSFT